MRTLTFNFLIFVLTTASLLAQDVAGEGEGKQKTANGATGTRGVITIKLPPMMSNIVQDILTKASSLDLSSSQQKELSEIREKYIFPMIRSEGDYRIYHIKVNDILSDPNFDPEKVKAEMKVLQEYSIKEISMAIDAIAAIRNVIGIDNFKVVMGVTALRSDEVKQ